MSTETGDSVCRDCSEEFLADSSPVVERCQRCAEGRQWREGAALVTWGPQVGKSVRLASSYDLINHAPAGRIAPEV